MPDTPRDVVVIGSGPAGLTAALYSARANLHPVLFEGVRPGGQLMTTTMVENWPGMRDGIMGPELMTEMRAQAERFGTEIKTSEVSRVDVSQRPFLVVGDDGTEVRTRALIVATGASPLLLGLPAEGTLMGHGVSTSATCDGFFFRNKAVAVVGGGDSAMEEATYLARLASQVTVIHRRDELRASKIMQEKAVANPKITFLWNTVVEDINDDARREVTGVAVRNTHTGESSTLPVEGLFLAIGHRPNTALFTGQLETDPNGYLLARNGTLTNVPGVFACGDVQDHVYRQAITAAGSGCMAALDAERYLEGIPRDTYEAEPVSQA
ncbi:MAG: thioredoxin-disulfide reductase [Vicinamibacteraceae bacterium]